ncbi:MAG: PqqD family protein, partial [Pedobacter sp.]
MGQSITLKSKVLATQNQVSTDLAGKKAILHLKNRNYYTLDEMASPIWECLQEEHTVEEIAQSLAGRYDVEPA